MEVCVVNLNHYKEDGLIEILLQEIAGESRINFFILFGVEPNSDIIDDDLMRKCIHISEYPISQQCIKELLAIYMLFHNKNCEQAILFNYGEEKQTLFFKNIPIYNSLDGYIYKSENDRERRPHIENILSNVMNRDDGIFEVYGDRLAPVTINIELDSMLYKLYSSEVSGCLYRLLEDDYWWAMRNSKIKEIVLKTIELIYKRVPTKKNYGDLVTSRLKVLRDVIDDYASYSMYENERASLLYCAFFMRMSIFYKNSMSSNFSYSLLLRAFEVLATFYLLKNGNLIISDGFVYIKNTNSGVSGVKILKEQLEACKVNLDGKLISKLIKIRNKSLVGHGFNFPHMDDFSDCYRGVNSLLPLLLLGEEHTYYMQCFDAFSFIKKDAYISEMKSFFNNSER